jgi:WD40 repeat protein
MAVQVGREWTIEEAGKKYLIRNESQKLNVYEEGSPLLASVGADHAIRLWLSNELTVPQDELYGHDAEVIAVFFGSSPTLLLSASQDGTVRFWDVDKPRAPPDLTQIEAEELETWIAKACQRAGRDFTADERESYFSDPETPSVCVKYLVTPGSYGRSRLTLLNITQP